MSKLVLLYTPGRNTNFQLFLDACGCKTVADLDNHFLTIPISQEMAEDGIKDPSFMTEFADSDVIVMGDERILSMFKLSGLLKPLQWAEATLHDSETRAALGRVRVTRFPIPSRSLGWWSKKVNRDKAKALLKALIGEVK